MSVKLREFVYLWLGLPFPDRVGVLLDQRLIDENDAGLDSNKMIEKALLRAEGRGRESLVNLVSSVCKLAGEEHHAFFTEPIEQSFRKTEVLTFSGRQEVCHLVLLLSRLCDVMPESIKVTAALTLERRVTVRGADKVPHITKADPGHFLKSMTETLRAGVPVSVPAVWEPPTPIQETEPSALPVTKKKKRRRRGGAAPSEL